MTTDPFVEHRSLLFTVAYEMLGSASEAEDVVQDAWLRWSTVDQSSIDSPRAYLVRVVAHQALNRLRSTSRRREDYFGEWLPEPVQTPPDVGEDLDLAEKVSIALLTVLETLGPVERAVFVLREVFETPYDEIAEVVGKTPETVRKIAQRAREHVAARRPRMLVDRTQQLAVVEKFLAALSNSDKQGVLDVLAANAVAIVDGGGVVASLPRPVAGGEKLAALWLHAAKAPDFGATVTWLNGMPGLRLTAAGTTAAVSFVIEQGRITRIYAITNPHKLRHFVTAPFPLTFRSPARG